MKMLRDGHARNKALLVNSLELRRLVEIGMVTYANVKQTDVDEYKIPSVIGNLDDMADFLSQDE